MKTIDFEKVSNHNSSCNSMIPPQVTTSLHALPSESGRSKFRVLRNRYFKTKGGEGSSNKSGSRSRSTRIAEPPRLPRKLVGRPKQETSDSNTAALMDDENYSSTSTRDDDEDDDDHHERDDKLRRIMEMTVRVVLEDKHAALSRSNCYEVVHRFAAVKIELTKKTAELTKTTAELERAHLRIANVRRNLWLVFSWFFLLFLLSGASLGLVTLTGSPQWRDWKTVVAEGKLMVQDSSSEFMRFRQGDRVTAQPSDTVEEALGPGPLLVLYNIPTDISVNSIRSLIAASSAPSITTNFSLWWLDRNSPELSQTLDEALETAASRKSLLAPRSFSPSSSGSLIEHNPPYPASQPVPVLLFSGFDNDDMLRVYNTLAQQMYVYDDIFGISSPALAVAAPNDMHKPLRQVFFEATSGDY